MTTDGSAPGNGRSAEWQQRDLVWHSDLRSREKLILLAFIECDRLARGRELFPSIDRIAWQTGLATSTVGAAVRVLKRRGILERVGHVPSRYAARGRVSRYLFHADHLPTRPEWAPDSRREPALVNPDSRLDSAPVDARQPPDHDATAAESRLTGAESAPDSRRITTRQPPALGGERTYERTDDRKKERTDEERTARCARLSDPEQSHEDHDEEGNEDLKIPPAADLERAAHEVFDALGDAPFFTAALEQALVERLAGYGFKLDDEMKGNLGPFLWAIRKQRRERRAGVR